MSLSSLNLSWPEIRSKRSRRSPSGRPRVEARDVQCHHWAGALQFEDLHLVRLRDARAGLQPVDHTPPEPGLPGAEVGGPRRGHGARVGFDVAARRGVHLVLGERRGEGRLRAAARERDGRALGLQLGDRLCLPDRDAGCVARVVAERVDLATQLLDVVGHRIDLRRGGWHGCRRGFAVRLNRV